MADLLKTWISNLVKTENIDGKLILTAKAVKNQLWIKSG